MTPSLRRMPIREALPKLVEGLNHADVCREKKEPVLVDEEFILRRGIADLDFSPKLFLKTEKTMPAGWSLQRGR